MHYNVKYGSFYELLAEFSKKSVSVQARYLGASERYYLAFLEGLWSSELPRSQHLKIQDN